LELLDGKTTLANAIWTPEFLLKGNTNLILRAYKSIEIVLSISQKSVRFIDLFNRYRYE
jgi:hypothetical protein